MNFGAFCEILPGKEGLIHVSELADKFVKNVERLEEFGWYWKIRARIVEQNFNEYKLTTASNNLGVIYTDCVICGNPLDRIGPNRLRCSRCGSVETRKLANDFGNVEDSLRF